MDASVPSRRDPQVSGLGDPATVSLLVYALVTFSVTLAATDAESPRRILLVLSGSAAALWIAHAYADATARDAAILPALKHAAPVFAVAAPAALILLRGWWSGWSGEGAVIVAEIVNLALLVTIQLLAARKRPLSAAQLAATALLDAVAAIVVVGTILLLK